MMICDAHIHMGYWPKKGEWLYCSPRRIANVMKRCGVDEWIVTSTTAQVESVASVDLLREMKELKRISGRRTHCFYWLTGRLYDSDRDLSFLSGDIFEGVKFHEEETAWVRERPAELDYILGRLESTGKHVMFHCGTTVGCRPRDIEPFVVKHPGIKFNLAHCPADLLGTMLRNQNVFTDTAFASMASVQEVVQAGLSGRLMFGSDFPIMAYRDGQGLTSTYRAAIKSVQDLEGNDFNGAFRRFVN